ncbi:DMT family transporter [Spongiactinospora sp. TRM90649]|uniref:DMT family transporter n=1 Tax=Spongiactinospora sp. TRM90649 TaxID=3031114 RepID=UPI0023F82E6F|nr:DMT family transporter [Spongiactinospora sp. TRM90649]MDF5754733.1 DMT family transporter [Spongiactinospora sp. TRM90649]
MSSRGGNSAQNITMAATAMFLVGTLAGVSDLIQNYPVHGGQAMRYAAGAAALLVLARLLGRRLLRPTLREWLRLLALTLTGLIVFNVAVIESARHAGPALVGTVLGTVPLALALLGGRRPAPHVLAGACVVVTGATIATGLGSGNLPALLWALVALACEVAFSLLALPLLPRLGAVLVSAYSTALSVPLFLVLGLVTDGAGMLRVPTLPEAGGLAYLAIAVTTGAFFLWYTALPRLGPAVAGLFAGMIPVGAIVTGLLLGVAVPTPGDLAGAGLVIAGIAVGLYGGRVIRALAVRRNLNRAERPAGAGTPGDDRGGRRDDARVRLHRPAAAGPRRDGVPADHH